MGEIQDSFHYRHVMQENEAFSQSPTDLFLNALPRRINGLREDNSVESFDSNDIKCLILDNISASGIEIFEERGYQIEVHSTYLNEKELINKISDVHVLCVGPKTRLPARVLEHARKLLVIGCFSVGTNHIDTDYAASIGVAVFNSPFSNTRSVAELAIGNILSLSRQLSDRSLELHCGIWNNHFNNCWEIRSKTLGIIGYGHIGSQVSVLAEALGMHILFYDIHTVMALGSATQVPTLNKLLKNSDFVCMCIPETKDTDNMMSAPQLAAMKKGSYLINVSAGNAIDIPSLIISLEMGHLAGVALDVYPNEPIKNGKNCFNDRLNSWTSKLVSLPNVILTPHIGGSTIEAQKASSEEITTYIVNYLTEGNSVGAVNFPEIKLASTESNKGNIVRIIYIHQNIPGVLKTVNSILYEHNIEKQIFDSTGKVSYMVTDISDANPNDIRSIYEKLNDTPAKISIRLLY